MIRLLWVVLSRFQSSRESHSNQKKQGSQLNTHKTNTYCLIVSEQYHLCSNIAEVSRTIAEVLVICHG